MSLQFDRLIVGNILVIRFIGELDHHTSDLVRNQVEEGLDQPGIQHLVINLEQLDFMDSSGLGVILGRYKRVSEAGGRTAVCSLNSSIRTLFEMSGLLKILAVYENEQAALQDIKEGFR